jgi:hypothetical protein
MQYGKNSAVAFLKKVLIFQQKVMFVFSFSTGAEW